MSEEIKKDETMQAEHIPVMEEVKPKKSKKAAKDDFVTRKLKVINNMSNPAKKRGLAERVLNNRKVGK